MNAYLFLRMIQFNCARKQESQLRDIHNHIIFEVDIYARHTLHVGMIYPETIQIGFFSDCYI